MKALVLESYKNLVYKEVPTPEYQPNEILVRVKACGICGSDIHGFDGSTGRRNPPLIMGHEASGVIEKLGEDVKGFSVGDRITFDSTEYPLNDWYTLQGRYNLSDNRKVLGVSPADYKRHGAFAEYVVISEHIAYKLPKKVSFDHAAMVEPFAVAMHAINMTPMKMRDSVLVVGVGMIGLCILQLLKLSHAGTIIAVDIDDKKLAFSKKFGADYIFNPEKENLLELVPPLTNGRGPDIAFEVVGISQTVKATIENVRKGGTVTLIGNLSRSIDFPLQQAVVKELRLQCSCAIAGEYPQVLELMEKGLIDVDAFLSATAPLSDGAMWFQRLYDREPDLFKVILKP